MKNLLLALVFVILMVGAALAVTSNRNAAAVGTYGVPAAAGVDQPDKACPTTGSCATKKAEKKSCFMSKGDKKECPQTGTKL